MKRARVWLAVALALGLLATACSGNGGGGGAALDGGATAESGAAGSAIGEACATRADCADNAACEQDRACWDDPTGCPRLCRAPCSADAACPSDQFCFTEKQASGDSSSWCVPRAAMGAPCNFPNLVDMPNSCVDGAYCDLSLSSPKAVCAATHAAGAACDNRGEPFECVDGYVCNADVLGQPLTCVKPTARGGACVSDTDCALTDFCKGDGVGGVCAARANKGGACTSLSTRPCAAGLTCTFAAPGQCTSWSDCHANQTACCAGADGSGTCTPGALNSCAPPKGTCE